jgi:hypothetical protein
MEGNKNVWYSKTNIARIIELLYPW